MRLTSKEEDDGMLGIIDNLGETRFVSEEQVGTLVGSKAAAESNDEGVGVHLLEEAEHT